MEQGVGVVEWSRGEGLENWVDVWGRDNISRMPLVQLVFHTSVGKLYFPIFKVQENIFHFDQPSI